MTLLRFIAPTLLILAPTLPAQELDLEAAEKELYTMFERPAGTTISDGQKAALADFLVRHRKDDLRHIGYAAALHEYFERRYDDAATELDEFFSRYPTIAHPEHAMMAGRIYLNAVRTEGEKDAPDLVKLTRWGERMTRLYPDTQLLARYVSAVLRRVDDPAPLRLALVRGVFASPAPDAAKDGFLAALYGGQGRQPRTARPAPAGADAAAGAATAPVAANGTKAAMGAPAPAFAALHALGGKAAFDAADYRGKVVVLDFWATWCPPCREMIPELVKSGEKYGDRVQLVGVTRFYGQGMDFSDPGASAPHGGRAAKSLSRQQEIAINEAFVERFGIGYPILFVGAAVASETYGVRVIPTMFVIDAEGKLVGKVTGGGEEQHRELEALIDNALGK